MALIDVTPIMTSNTTPMPYVVSTSSEYNSSQQGWKAFNGIKNANADAYWGTSLNTPTGWIKLDFGKNTKTTAFSISSCILKTTGTDNLLRNPKDFTLYGSYDGIDYFKIVELENEMNWEIGETRVYSYNPVDFRYYKLSVNKNNGDSTIMLITELRYLYDDSYDKSVSHTYASLNYQLPMAPTDVIKSRINDTREGLPVIASDQENYGDLYVVGKDRKAHLTRSGVKSELLWSGLAYTGSMNQNLSKYKYIYVAYRMYYSISRYHQIIRVPDGVETITFSHGECWKDEYGYGSININIKTGAFAIQGIAGTYPYIYLLEAIGIY